MGTEVTEAPLRLRLHNAVRERRLERGWNTDQLGVYAGLAPRVVRQIEANDGHNPTAETMLRLASALGCELADLFWSEPDQGAA